MYKINFTVSNNKKYLDSCMGKTPDKDKSRKVIYWYGLLSDGSEEYEYNNLEDILKDKVFNGKSLVDLIDDIDFLSIDGSDVYERLEYYIEK